jgi:carbon-monoxide dehydrogenase small subunit
MKIDLMLNFEEKHVSVRSGDRLVDVLRKEFSLESLLPDCLSGSCGKCIVVMDGRLTYSCLVPAFKAQGTSILTYEEISRSKEAKDIDVCFAEAGNQPCAFCKAAKTLVIVDLLSKNPLPDRPAILDHLSMISCPCTDPYSLVEVILAAADRINKRKFNRENQ